MKKNIDGLLFSDGKIPDKPIIKPLNTPSVSHKKRKEGYNNLNVSLTRKDVGMYEMPEVKGYDGPVPSSLIPFNVATSSTSYECGVHFFIDDYHFERIWSCLDRYIPLLSKFRCVIGPDFSQFRDMPYPARMWNHYRNQLVTSYYQEKGVRVIPNVTWSLPDSYDYCFDGIPSNSTIAINCTSIAGCRLSKYLWYKGYEEAIRRLNPSRIIRYGTVMPGEKTEISYYFENERLNYLRNGRKR